MMHSQMPVPSLLCALLMLPLGMLQDYPDVPLTDLVVQMSTAFAVQQYNKDRYDSTNYFKELRLLKAQSPVDSPFEYHLTVVLVKTACKKRADKIKSYKKIQQCKALRGNHRQITCAFKVTFRDLVNMKLEVTVCN
ncbi:cystatin-1-like [Crotalus tigris]|uniref:cystatin-1-like n=1 Tax=Crotalus tigris TaxID=88082 RepID=UPI00192F88FC|nr:cystatin-1-like [Crotalus tigris]